MKNQLLKKIFASPFKPLYDEARISYTIRRSLFMMILGNALGNMSSQATAGSAFTGYASALGANDFVFGLLNALPILGALIQLPAAMLIGKTGKRKQYFLAYGIPSRMLWILAGFIPYFVPVSPEWLQIWTFIMITTLIAISGSMINVGFTPWMGDLVPMQIRGRFIGLRNRIISALSMVTGIVMAYILDHLGGFSGYTLVFVLGGILGTLDICCFIFVQDIPVKITKGETFGVMLKTVFTDKRFMKYLTFWTLWCFSSNLAAPYLIRYALGPMQLSFIQVTIASQITASLVSIFAMPHWGRFLDRYGSRSALLVTSTITSVTFGFWLFASPGNVLIVFLYHLVGALFWSGTDLTVSSMLLSYTPADRRTGYVAVQACVTSLFGSFIAILIAGAFLQSTEGHVSFSLIGIAMDHYKLLFAIAMLLRVLIVIFFVPKIDNDRDASLKDAVRDAKLWFLRARMAAKQNRLRRKARKSNP